MSPEQFIGSISIIVASVTLIAMAANKISKRVQAKIDKAAKENCPVCGEKERKSLNPDSARKGYVLWKCGAMRMPTGKLFLTCKHS